MMIHFELSERFYGVFQRIACSLESIDRTLKAPPEDFSSEDQEVNTTREKVQEALERIPHGT